MDQTFKKGDYVNVNSDLGYFWAEVANDVYAGQRLVPVRIDISEEDIHSVLNIHKDYVHSLREYVETNVRIFIWIRQILQIRKLKKSKNVLNMHVLEKKCHSK